MKLPRLPAEMPDLPVRSFARIAATDLLRGRGRVRSARAHLDAAVAWLERAHDHGTDGGVSYGYSVYGGWRPNYRETSGYIAVTFFDLARALDRPDLAERAVRIADWCVRVQNEDGGVANPHFTNDGIVFDTGQVLLGLVRAWDETGEERFRRAAEKAGDWLVRVADDEGRWTRFTHKGVPHVYNARVAWALVQLHLRAPSDDRLRVARANLDWAVSQQRGPWYERCAFEEGKAPFTHTIAYAMRGLLEAGLLLDEPAYIASARRAADGIVQLVDARGFVPGQIDTEGRPAARYCCLTGNAQLSIVLSKLASLPPDADRGASDTDRAVYADAATRTLRYVMACQDLDTDDLDVRGAIKGSQPAWGRYSRMTFPNWPTKFFIDALLAADLAALRRVKILNGEFDVLTLDETVDEVEAMITRGERGWLCTVNVAILMAMRDDPDLARFVEKARLVVADGQPLVWASRSADAPLPERVTGVDLIEHLCARAAARGLGVYLLGATREVVEKTAQRLRERYPGLDIRGVADGYFGPDEAAARADAVRESGAEILIVAMGVPRQERFIEAQWERLGASFAIGVGGSFDVISGLRARAPVVLQRLSLEWAFRMAQEPRRLAGRYFTTNTRFIYLAGRDAVARDGAKHRKRPA
ncbi:MAG: WecB/TagA/CpsF family glycosyltransferase [Myxococcales bacterium]|nr:WecB/TagA/CpsF family glycosyltransferase [Myxococcales bacterium]